MLLVVFLVRLVNLNAHEFEATYSNVFKESHVPFSLSRNVLLPGIGLSLLCYLCYLFFNLVITPWLWPKKNNVSSAIGGLWLKRPYILLLTLASLTLVIAVATCFAVYLKDEWLYSYPGFSIFFVGHNSQASINLAGIFTGVLLCTTAYFVYAVIREAVIAKIESRGDKSVFLILIFNQVTGFLNIYIIFIFGQLALGIPPAGPVMRLYIALLFSVALIFIEIYRFFPANQNHKILSRKVLGKLLLLTFLMAIPFTLIVGFGRPVPFLVLAWAFHFLVVTPLAWFFYRQQKDKILAIRGIEKALVKSNADLQFLRSQVNPHFLFNALNTIFATALRENAEATAESIQVLGDMMRFMLHENNKDIIPLQREIEYLQNFIALQKLRLPASEQIIIEVNLPDELPNLQIAPMLLVPFVENAFKHGISLNEKSWVKIRLTNGSGSMHFEVTNSMHAHTENDTEADKSGIGLANVRERLALIYPKKHTLTVNQANNEFSVQLTIDL